MQALINGAVLDRRSPWELQTDGGLWSACQKSIMRKGPNSVRVTWVKGHATAEDIQQGIATLHSQ